MNREVPKSRSTGAGSGEPAPRSGLPSKREAAVTREPSVPKREAAPGTRVTSNNTGRVKFDERGNAVWEWAVTTGAFGTDVSTERLKKLESHNLALADDASPDDIAKKPKSTAQGYSPYDSGLLVKQEDPPQKKKDLKRLSEWFKLREQANRNKKENE